MSWLGPLSVLNIDVLDMDAASKVIYLAVTEASKKWTMPIRNWRGALNRLTIEFEDRLADYV